MPKRDQVVAHRAATLTREETAAEITALRRVRDAAQAVAAALREHIPRCACTVCGLRAALDAAKDES